MDARTIRELELLIGDLRMSLTRAERVLAKIQSVPAEFRQFSTRDQSKTSLGELPMSARLTNCMRSIGANYVEDVKNVPDAQLLKVWNFGRLSLEELRGLIGPPLEPYTYLEKGGPGGYRVAS